jgi:DNA gyrase subunit B/topoisomerase-4 subunit B
MSNGYTVDDIQVLKGLEAVRKRPGMYIGDTGIDGLHQLVWEILDNSVDEALNGHCDFIEVILYPDGSISLEDWGRGIPVEVHPTTGKNTVETIFCNLHAGGKFDDDVYKVAGGLHGVGAAVVNALSDKLVVEVRRDGIRYKQEFSKGIPLTPLKKLGKAEGTGTRVLFIPDSDIFSSTVFSKHTIRERLETKAFLIAGLTVKLRDIAEDSSETFVYPEGISDFLKKLVSDKTPIDAQPFSYRHDNGLKFEMVLAWTVDTAGKILSFVNSIPTPAGGTHETGFRNGLTRALRTYIEKKNGLPKGVKNVTAEDVREGLLAIVSVYLNDIEFQGQTKDRLNSASASQVEPLVKTAFETWLHQNPTQAAAIVNRVVLAAQARTASRAARDEVTRKAATRRLMLPGKLADCSSTSRVHTELFIVEGDSAGGSSKQARDRRFQAILPIRGKILNVEQASAEKMKANKEIQSLVQSIGTGMGPTFDYSRLRYGKIIINTDADVDGHHIATLLLTFFYRFLPVLVEKGHVYLAMPPLYRIRMGSGKKTLIKYVFSDDEKNKLLKTSKNGKEVEIQRFKGLGEMDAQTLKNTTMDPQTRTLLKIGISDRQKTHDIFDTLMGKDVRKRFIFIKEHAREVQDLDI